MNEQAVIFIKLYNELADWLQKHDNSEPICRKSDYCLLCITEDTTKAEAITLEEMIKFRKDVHDCCHHLYQLECNKKNITLLEFF